MQKATFRSDLAFSVNAERRECHCATLVELPNGDLMAAWYAGSREGNPDVAILGARLPAGETHWTPARVLVPAAHEGQGNPVLFLDRRDRVHLVYDTRYGPSWQECEVHFKISTDQGRTWGPQCALHEEHGWMVRNKPIQLCNGEILLPIYDEIKWSSMVLISSDEGDHWSVHGNVTAPTGCIQPTVIQSSDGELLMFLRTGGTGGCIRRTTSPDNGRTWTQTTGTDLPNPNSGIDMVRLANGHLVLCYNDSSTARTPLTVALSTDEGETWPIRRHLETDEGEYSYPAIIQTTDGLIHLIYTHRRTSIKHVAFTEEWLR